MRIGAIQKFSMVDYPGKLSAIIFTQGCNFRCPYCHNPELVEPDKFQNTIPISEIKYFLEKRKGKLSAVCITGGEPTIHNDLPEMIKIIKKMGFSVKLDTNGTNPQMLEKLINQEILDYIAMDIKAPLDKYPMVTNSEVNLKNIEKSIKLIRNSKVTYEFRTTVLKLFLNNNDLLKIRDLISGAEKYYIQNFVSIKTLDNSLQNQELTTNLDLDIIKNDFRNYFDKFAVR